MRPGQSYVSAGLAAFIGLLVAAQDPPAVCEFTFEERSIHPWDLPPAFVRLTRFDDPTSAAPGKEYTTFGSITFDSEAAHSGQWSLRFDLQGGSMGLALASQERVPAIEGESHQVTAFLRTTGLRHALPRITAMYVDQHGAIIESSRRFVETSDTAGEWALLRVALPPAPAGAASISLLLEVLQPAYRRERISDFEPLFEDVAGCVWFDDIQIERDH